MRGGSKWFKGFLGKLLSTRRRSKEQRLNRSGGSISSYRSVLKLASSAEKNAILKVIFEQATDQVQMQDIRRSFGESEEGFHSCRSSITSDLQRNSPNLLDNDQDQEQEQQKELQEKELQEKELLSEHFLRRLQSLRSSDAPSHLRIYAVTWNMNGKVPYSSLPKLLENGRGEYDLYVIGVQESPVASLRRRLHPILGRQYNLVAKSVLGALQIYVFGKNSLHVSGKKVDKVRFGGFGSVIGRQKGAVAASFCIGKSSFLFIASHFAAHENKLKERNVQYLRAHKKMFSRLGVSKSRGGNAPVQPDDFAAARSFVDTSDVVVWLGDLNYRIEGSKGLVKSFVKLNLEKLLWKRDQLFNAVDKGDVFNGFVEGPLVFKPTYKYDVGTDNYDTSDKERVPSWTDRILIKVKDESSVGLDVENYYSIDGLRTSDHRPVKALLRVSNLN